MKKLLIAAFSVSAVAANAVILYEQGNVTLGDDFVNEIGFISNEFSDAGNTQFSTYVFDNVTNADMWHIESVWVEGITQDPVGAASYHLRFSQNANFTAPGNIGLTFTTTEASTMGADKDLIFNLQSGLDLAPGTWYMSAWVVNNFSTSGQWAWKTTTTVVGGEAIAHNPAGGFGFGTAPVTLSGSGGVSVPSDVQFRIEGTPVPEPGTFVAIGLGLAGLALARRRK